MKKLLVGAFLAFCLIPAAFAQKRLLQAADLVSMCAQTGQRLYCDSALNMVKNQPKTETLHLVRGNAYYNIFRIEQEEAMTRAYAAIGERDFTTNRGYQFIGEAHRETLRQHAERAIFHLRQVPDDEQAKLSIHELEDFIKDMKLQW